MVRSKPPSATSLAKKAQRKKEQLAVANKANFLRYINGEVGLDVEKMAASNHRNIFMKNVEAFHYFPKLPTELRLAIWEEVCRQVRIVELRVEILTHGLTLEDIQTHEGRAVRDPTEKFPYKYRSGNGIPSILHTSHEARHVGMKYYAPAFPTKSIIDPEDPGKYIDSPPCAYMNWEIDTICPVQSKTIPQSMQALDTTYLLYSALYELKCIQHIAVDRNGFEDDEGIIAMLFNSPIESLVCYFDNDAPQVHSREGEYTDASIYNPAGAHVIKGVKHETRVKKLRSMQTVDFRWDALNLFLEGFTEAMFWVDDIETEMKWRSAMKPKDLKAEKWKRPEVKMMIMAKPQCLKPRLDWWKESGSYSAYSGRG